MVLCGPLPEVGGQAKVPNLEGHVPVEEHVAQLQVPVQDPLQVNVPAAKKKIQTCRYGILYIYFGALMNYPCLFCPSEKF